MNERHNNPEHEDGFAREDAFARELEKRHELLVGSEAPPEDGAPEDLGDRVDQAAEVLALLEMARPWISPESQAGVKTADDAAPTRFNESEADAQRIATDEVFSLRRLGRFELVEQIGRGGFGIVLRGHDPKLDRAVAIKIPRLETALSSDARARFQREARAAAALNHPGLVAVHEVGADAGIDYLVSEYVEGENLAVRLARGERFTPAQSAEWVAQLADAMHHAHERGVLHRDLKPSNIMISQQPPHEPKITDFGLAALADQQDVTQTGAALGTPAYMAPEQATGDKELLGPATDVYGLGAILYELLTGHSPFPNTPLVELIGAIAHRDPESPRASNPEVPRDLEAICLKCLEKKPGERYLSSLDLQADLNRFLSGQPVVARRTTRPQRWWRWARRNPLLAISMSATLVFLSVAVAASSVGWWMTSRSLDRERIALADAQTQYFRMKGVVESYCTTVSENQALKTMPGAESLRQELLNQALGYFQTYIAEQRDDPDLELDIARTRFLIGELYSELQQPTDALPEYEAALNVFERYLEERPDSMEFQGDVARGCNRVSRSRSAIGVAKDVEALAIRAIAIQQGLHDRQPDDPDRATSLVQFQTYLASLYRQDNQFAAALEQLESTAQTIALAREANPDDFELRLLALQNKMWRSNELRRLGKTPLAESLADELVEELTPLASARTNDWELQDLLLTALNQRARFFVMRQNFADALPLLDQAMPIAERLCILHADHPKYLDRKAAVLRLEGVLYSQLSNLSRAVESMKAELAIRERLFELEPNSSWLALELAHGRFNLGLTLMRMDANDPAIDEQLARSLELVNQLADNGPMRLDYHLLQANVNNVLCDVHFQRADYDTARTFGDSAIASLTELGAKFPGNPGVAHVEWSARGNRAKLLDKLEQFDQASLDWRRAAELSPPPRKLDNRLHYAISCHKSGQTEAAREVGAELLDDDPFPGSKRDALLAAHLCALVAADSSGPDRETWTGRGVGLLEWAAASEPERTRALLSAHADELSIFETDSRFRVVAEAVKSQ